MIAITKTRLSAAQKEVLRRMARGEVLHHQRLVWGYWFNEAEHDRVRYDTAEKLAALGLIERPASQAAETIVTCRITGAGRAAITTSRG